MEDGQYTKCDLKFVGEALGSQRCQSLEMDVKRVQLLQKYISFLTNIPGPGTLFLRRLVMLRMRSHMMLL